MAIDQWRARADELRECAETASNEISRRSLLDLADQYDRLAERGERRSTSNVGATISADAAE
jgi:hypothetical protein